MFGLSTFGHGEFGTVIRPGYGSIASTSTVNTFGIAQWPGHSLAYSTSVVFTFGGLLKGGTTYMQGTGTMYSHPVFQWAGFGDIETVQGTTLTYGYIAWDGQEVSDTTWTNFQVD